MDRSRKLFVLGVASLVTACTAVLGVEDVPNAPTPDAGSAEASVGDSGDSLPSAMSAYANAFCTRFQSCEPGNFDFNYSNMADCLNDEAVLLAYAIGLPGTGFNAAAFTDCATKTTALSCDDRRSAVGDLACAPKGTKALGEKCVADYQCDSGLCDSDETNCRACITAPQVGEACTPGGFCAYGLVCAANKCVREAPLGSACDEDSQPCVGSAGCSGGSCVQLPATLNAPCSADLQCDTAKGFVCNGTKCIAYTISAAGTSCGTTATAEAVCRKQAACTNGTCAVPPVLNEPCDDTTGPYCPSGLLCTNGICSPEPADSFCN